MKGQIFILISVFVLLSLFLMRINTKTIEIQTEDLFYEYFSNLKNELIKTIDISILNEENLQNNLDNFIDFSANVSKNKGYTENVNYTILEYGGTTIVYLNISLISRKSYLKENLIINRTVYT